MLPQKLETVSLDIAEGKLYINGNLIEGDVSELRMEFSEGVWTLNMSECKRYTGKGKALP